LFNVIDGYEFANQLAEIHPEFGLKMAQVTSAPQHSVNFAAIPNPFKQVTSIAANLAFDGYLKIVVTNLVGKEICILADKMVNSGKYSFNFDASRYNLTPGVYLAKIEYGTSSNKYSDVLKLVLIK
jgi:hypothetical protein